jgi:TolB protein
MACCKPSFARWGAREPLAPRAARLAMAAVRWLMACWLLAGASAVTLAAESERLTHDGRLKFTPQFRSEGAEVVFTELVNPTLYQLRRLVLADGHSEPLHPNASTSEFEPACSADGECYAFLKTRSALNVSVVICDRRGVKLAEILPGEGFCGHRSPAVATDHSRVAFAYAEKGRQEIYSTRPDGSDRKKVTDAPGICNWPSFSPRGDAIVFASSRDGNFEIYRIDADGSNPRRLTDSPFQDIRPRFSPDGTRIAFTSHRDGNAEVYVMNADGSEVHRITDNAERDDYPDWHPDGQRLIMVSEREGRHDLYVVPVPH